MTPGLPAPLKLRVQQEVMMFGHRKAAGEPTHRVHIDLGGT